MAEKSTGQFQERPAVNSERFKKFTILHSNDMHGDFLAEAQGAEGKLVGGLALLSGYINKVRREEKNVIYLISGDMVQGSMIDSEYKGISTMEIMNYIAPDVVTIGNHELDYGLPHLLFLEKMADFPIVNANLYLKKYHKRLMRPYHIINMDGFDILFIGIITDTVIAKIKMDSDIGAFVGLEDAVAEVGKICNAYKDEDIDLTVLLTHIGFESDKKLAGMLNPEWGVDMIIGGHSHTILDQPAEVNSVLIAQAGVGTDQIGRFDIVVDDDTNSIVEWEWELIPVDNNLAEPDGELQKFIDSFQEVVDRKYNRMLCRLVQKLTHPRRVEETALGNLFADIFADLAQVDIAFVGSGAIRETEMGSAVTLGDLKRVWPYDDTVYKVTITGAQVRRIFEHYMHPDNKTGEGEYFQVSRGVQAVYDETRRSLESLTFKGEAVEDDRHHTICLGGYRYKNPVLTTGLTTEELTTISGTHVVTTSELDVLEEYLSSHQHLNSKLEERLVYK